MPPGRGAERGSRAAYLEHGRGQCAFPQDAQGAEGLKGVAHQAEREAILQALERNGYNKSRTAEQLNIDRKTLYNKLKSFGLEV